MALHVLGIRHHGPGSARSVGCALEQIEPDVILVEGPADAEGLIGLAGNEEMRPPVAMLAWALDDPSSALYFPFAAFSPEWVALRYAVKRGVTLRFIDLPASVSLALEAQRKTPEPLLIPEPGQAEADERMRAMRDDPLLALAEAAGYADSELFWEHMVEERRDGAPLFEAIAEAMQTLRQRVVEEGGGDRDDRREQVREAHMRMALRQARKQGHERIVVVCGAWHVPALIELPAAARDRPLLTKLPKRKVALTWIPWSHGRLTFASGYGAGVQSPGWYHHLFTCPDQVAVRWLNRVAAHLRDQGLDVSSAQVIDAVRLSEALAAMRDRPAPGLAELHESAQAVLLAGETLPWSLIHDALVVGASIGQVPPETPTVPLQHDLIRLQKRLRLKPQDGDRELVLDLRKDVDRERSLLLRRLRLIDIPWGEGGERGEGTGTFKETWELAWDPEFALQIIEASPHGATVRAAAATLARQRAERSRSLPELAHLVRGVVLAGLPEALPFVMTRMQNEAAVANDLTHLMHAVPDLVHLVRYGDVRGTEAAPVRKVVDGMVARVCVGLPSACASLRDDAARSLFVAVSGMQAALSLLGDEAHTAAWHAALLRVADDPRAAPVLRGRACRLLLEAGRMTPDDTARRFSYNLSRATPTERTAAWLDGFLHGSGQVLVYDDTLFSLVDTWLAGLSEDAFTQLLPLLRRTMSTFTEPERRAIGQLAAEGERAESGSSTEAEPALDETRAQRALALACRLLGLQEGA